MTIFALQGWSQGSVDANGQIQKSKSRIMVVPVSKQGEDVRKLIEDNANLRIAITKIKESFELRGIQTIDFIQKLKAAQTSAAFTSDGKQDEKTALIRSSGADIYVEVDIILDEDAERGNSVRLLLNAFEVQSAITVAAKSGESRRVVTNDVSKLITMALEPIIEEFQEAMYTKFNELLDSGRPIMIVINFLEDSDKDMDTELGPDNEPLADLIEKWMEQNAYRNDYHLQGTTEIQMIFDYVKIPFFDQETMKNYTPQKFCMELQKMFKLYGITSSRNILDNTVQIKIK